MSSGKWRLFRLAFNVLMTRTKPQQSTATREPCTYLTYCMHHFRRIEYHNIPVPKDWYSIITMANSITLFLNNRFDDIQLVPFISDLHTALRIVRRSILGFATGSACGVWGRRWTTYLLYADASLVQWIWIFYWFLAFVNILVHY